MTYPINHTLNNITKEHAYNKKKVMELVITFHIHIWLVYKNEMMNFDLNFLYHMQIQFLTLTLPFFILHANTISNSNSNPIHYLVRINELIM